jgi:hypothetical protein
MTFLLLTGFFPEPNPDSSLQYEKDIPPDLEALVLSVMGWASQKDVPAGDHELTAAQASKIFSILGEPLRPDLIYGIGLCIS